MTKTTKQPAVGLRFIGKRGPDGKPEEFIGWAPTRDLTAEEVATIEPWKVEALIASNLYAWDSGTTSKTTTAPATVADDSETEGE